LQITRRQPTGRAPTRNDNIQIRRHARPLPQPRPQPMKKVSATHPAAADSALPVSRKSWAAPNCTIVVFLIFGIFNRITLVFALT